MGYSAEQAQLYVIPVYLVATVVTLSAAVLTDRYNSRYIVTMVALTVGMVGYAVLLAGTSIPVRGRYAACFLTVSASFTALPVSLAWCNFQVSRSSFDWHPNGIRHSTSRSGLWSLQTRCYSGDDHRVR